MSKFAMTASKVYKPEILTCPFCNSKLIYKHAVSNKTVQFSSGKHFKIVNLGYGCPKCDDGRIYFSQTANKLSFKGYTFSAKLLCMVDYYKKKGYNREQIYDIFEEKNINISDRNIDIIYKKLFEDMKTDFTDDIFKAYDNMMEEYHEIRISVDQLTIEETKYVIMYDFFSGERLAIWTFPENDDEAARKVLKKYINETFNITVIASIRNINSFLPLLKSLVTSKTKFVTYAKF